MSDPLNPDGSLRGDGAHPDGADVITEAVCVPLLISPLHTTGSEAEQDRSVNIGSGGPLDESSQGDLSISSTTHEPYSLTVTNMAKFEGYGDPNGSESATTAASSTMYQRVSHYSQDSSADADAASFANANMTDVCRVRRRTRKSKRSVGIPMYEGEGKSETSFSSRASSRSSSVVHDPYLGSPLVISTPAGADAQSAPHSNSISPTLVHHSSSNPLVCDNIDNGNPSSSSTDSSGQHDHQPYRHRFATRSSHPNRYPPTQDIVDSEPVCGPPGANEQLAPPQVVPSPQTMATDAHMSAEAATTPATAAVAPAMNGANSHNNNNNSATSNMVDEAGCINIAVLQAMATEGNTNATTKKNGGRDVMCPAGWHFEIFDVNTNESYKVPSERVALTDGAIKYCEGRNANITTGQPLQRFSRCKKFVEGNCQAGLQCNYLHTIMMPSNDVHVNLSSFPVDSEHLQPAGDLSDAQSGEPLAYAMLPEGANIFVYAPNSGSVQPQIIPSEKILKTAGSQNAFGTMKATQDQARASGDMAAMTTNKTPLRPKHCAHFQLKRVCYLGTSCNFVHSLVKMDNQPSRGGNRGGGGGGYHNKGNANLPPPPPFQPNGGNTGAMMPNQQHQHYHHHGHHAIFQQPSHHQNAPQQQHHQVHQHHRAPIPQQQHRVQQPQQQQQQWVAAPQQQPPAAFQPHHHHQQHHHQHHFQQHGATVVMGSAAVGGSGGGVHSTTMHYTQHHQHHHHFVQQQ